jgi:hypothetical protein
LEQIRPIREEDLPAVTALYCEMFPGRDAAYFETGFKAIAGREIPVGTETYGYLIDDDGPQGAILTISSWHGAPDARQLYINLSTWCARRSHLHFARELYRLAGERNDAVNTNLSAAPHTIKSVLKCGYEARTTGQFATFAARGRGTRGRVLTPAQAFAMGMAEHHRQMLEDHAKMGALTPCLEAEGRILPLMMVRRKVRGFIPAAQLIYCADTAWLYRNAHALFWWLRLRGLPALIVDANGPVPQFVGRFFPGKGHRYFRGLEPGLDVDHSYSEMVYLGI